ncbi:LOW QUALITY PROTEIN: hypothetical protein Cgig2_005913 [Carnegiea gigantea]|uniref:Uncharacterized protein n=1 Tax=Carnegiea gigantea TaxID=171969 RepID=A0A9Q1Q849_9CARY|nr:LOW QUALITY PROTEIN: hypothetical protein Cgig2_005913 [Carnegiea gigantea]
MDANQCNINLLDADVVLPPWKHLPVGLKKQSRSKSKSQCSRENKPSPSPSPLSPAPLISMLIINSNFIRTDPTCSRDSGGSWISSCCKTAQAARAANCRTDEELAQRLHRAMNNSSRISKRCLRSEYNNDKYKQLKILPPSGKTGIAYGTSMGNDTGKFPLAHNGDAIEVGMDRKRSNEEPYITKKWTTVKQSRVVPRGILWNYMTCASGRKRSRIKLKNVASKHMQDQANAKEELNLTNAPKADKSSASHVSSLSVELPADNITPRKFMPT